MIFFASEIPVLTPHLPQGLALSLPEADVALDLSQKYFGTCNSEAPAVRGCHEAPPGWLETGTLVQWMLPTVTVCRRLSGRPTCGDLLGVLLKLSSRGLDSSPRLLNPKPHHIHHYMHAL